MEIIQVEELSFAYPHKESSAIRDISLKFNKGEFVLVTGPSGSGKSTFLRKLKPSLSPHGNSSGKIFFYGEDINNLSKRDEASKIGFVQQRPENQVVTDRVYHELAFGLESLGYKTEDMRLRVAEIANFFGMETLFYRDVNTLSGGQLQLLNLASVMAMEPELLILDEPTSQLDPISSRDFIGILRKVNDELGTTIIVSAHKTDELLPISDRLLVMEDGRIVYNEDPRELSSFLRSKSSIIQSLPAPVRIYAGLKSEKDCPLTVNEGRQFISSLQIREGISFKERQRGDRVLLEGREVFFRYKKDSPDVLKGVNIKIMEGDIFSVVGGNGAGKTTLMKVLTGLYPRRSGKILVHGKKIKDFSDLFPKVFTYLPQAPQTLFVKDSVKEDLLDVLGKVDGARERLKEVVDLMNLGHLLDSHPYDLSGGEQQRAALGKIFLLDSEAIILDEPTKGMDGHFKEHFASILTGLNREGKTIILISHDLEFVAEVSNYSIFMFNGEEISQGETREFFSGNTFYTTPSNLMMRDISREVLTVEEAIGAVR